MVCSIESTENATARKVAFYLPENNQEDHMNRTAQHPARVSSPRDFYRAMLAIALPVMAQNLITSLVNLIDTIMIGNLGEAEIAAVGIANQYFFLYHMFLVGLSAGCSVFIAQFWGQKDTASIRRVLGLGLLSAALVAALMIAVGFLFPEQLMALFSSDPQVIEMGIAYLRVVLGSYLFAGITLVYSFASRSIGQAVLPMLVGLVALVTNALLNYAFIFGHWGAPALGVAGAALATLVARIVETLLLIGLLYRSRGVLAASLRELLDFDFSFVVKAYRTIVPVLFNDIFWGLAALIYVLVYARMGTQAMAAYQICNTINYLFLVAVFGLSSAAAVIIGNNVGAGQEELANQYARKFILVTVEISVVLGLLLAAASPLILNFYNISETVRHDAQLILLTVALAFFVRALSIVLIVGVMRGGGDVHYAFVLETLTMWLVGVPLTLAGAFLFRWPVYLVYAMSLVEELVKSFFGLARLRSGHWMRNVTSTLSSR